MLNAVPPDLPKLLVFSGVSKPRLKDISEADNEANRFTYWVFTEH